MSLLTALLLLTGAHLGRGHRLGCMGSSPLLRLVVLALRKSSVDLPLPFLAVIGFPLAIEQRLHLATGKCNWQVQHGVFQAPT